MLVYIYGGKIDNIEEKSDKLLAASDQVMRGWLTKAWLSPDFQYALRHLKRKCEELLCQSLNISNCLDLLILADLHSTDILKPTVIKVPTRHCTAVKRIITCCLVCCGEQQGGRHSGEVEGEAYDVPGSVRGRVQVIKSYYSDWLLLLKKIFSIFDY